MVIVAVLAVALIAVAIAGAVRDIRSDGYRRVPTVEAEWRAKNEGQRG